MRRKNAICAVCGRDAEMWWWQQHAGQEVRCTYCGFYRIGDQTFRWLREQAAKKQLDPLVPYLSAYIRQAPEPPLITLDSWRDAAQPVAARTTEARADKVLQLLKERSSYHGKSVAFDSFDKPLADLAHDEEAAYVLRFLAQRGLIESGGSGYVVTPRGWDSGNVDPSRPGRIFLSHAAADAALAAMVAAEIRGRVPDVEVFVSSQPGQIATGEKWLEAIEQKLLAGDTFVILLTPASVERRWVWFEVGSFWFSGKRILPVAAGGLDLAAVPHPLSARQALNLEDSSQLQQFFRDLMTEVVSGEAEVLVQAFRQAARQAGGPWESCVFEGVTCVWDGPLGDLQDWSAVLRAIFERVLVLDDLERRDTNERCIDFEIPGGPLRQVARHRIDRKVLQDAGTLEVFEDRAFPVIERVA